jgi:hypothetical protein
MANLCSYLMSVEGKVENVKEFVGILQAEYCYSKGIIPE